MVSREAGGTIDATTTRAFALRLVVVPTTLPKERNGGDLGACGNLCAKHSDPRPLVVVSSL
jgi:hypothetical protein